MAEIKNTISLEDKLTPVLNKMIGAMTKTLNSMNSLDGVSERSFKSAENAIKQANNELLKFSQNVNTMPEMPSKVSSSFSSLGQTLQGVAGAIYTVKNAIAGLSGITNFSDDLTLMDARLKLISSDVETTKNKIYAAANGSRGSYTDFASQVAKLGMQAGEAFNNSEDEIISFSNTLNKMFTVSGLGSNEISSVMYNLTQSLSSGALLGQDYRILRQNAPKFREALQDYYGVNSTELQDMVSAGKVSAQDVKLAIFQAADDINKQFETFPMTFETSMTKLKNRAVKNFEIINKKINDLLNSEATIKFMDSIGNAIDYSVGMLNILFDKVADLFNYIVEGYNLIKPYLDDIAIVIGAVITGAIVNMGAKWLIAGADAVKSIVKTTGALIVEHSWLIALVGVIAGFGLLWKNMGADARDVIDSIVIAIEVVIGVFKNGIAVVWNAVRSLAINTAQIFDKLFGTELAAKISMKEMELKTANEMVEGGYAKGEAIYKKISSIGNSLQSIASDVSGFSIGGMDISKIDSVVSTTGEVTISEEDIKLLKDVAATEFVNRYTTLKPVLNASFGDVNENADVNGIMDAIGDMIEEALAESMI